MSRQKHLLEITPETVAILMRFTSGNSPYAHHPLTYSTAFPKDFRACESLSSQVGGKPPPSLPNWGGQCWNSSSFSHLHLSVHLMVPCNFLTHKEWKEKVLFMQMRGTRCSASHLSLLLMIVWGRAQHHHSNMNLGRRGSLMPKNRGPSIP